MDPRLLVPFQSEHFNPYLERHGSQHLLSLSSLQPNTGFYSLESYEHPPPGVPSSSMSATPLPPAADRLSYPLLPHFENLQPPPFIAPGGSHDAGHWARNSVLSTGFASSQVYGPGYDDMLQPVSGSMQLAPPTHGWSAEPYQQQSFHARKYDRTRAKGLNATGTLRRAPKPWPTKRLGKRRHSAQGEPVKSAGSEPAKLVNVAPTAGKAKSLEEGPGWCSLCRIDCNTGAILKQHLSGKKHRKHLQQQNSAVILNPSDIDKSIKGSTVADAIEQMWLTVSTMGKVSKSAISEADAEKVVATGDGNGATATNSLTGDGKKRLKKGENKNEEKDFGNSTGSNGLKAADSDVNVGGQKLEQIRCELCNVDCNSRTVLEIHFTGKKHQSRLKKSLT